MTRLLLFAIIGAFLICNDSVLCSPWPDPRNRVERATENLLRQGNSDFRIVTDPKTGQRFKKPITEVEEWDGVGRNKGEPMKTAGPILADRMKSQRVKGYRPSEDYDAYFETPDQEYEPPTVAGHPPFIKEHLVTAHIRPIWSNQRELNQNDDREPRRRISNGNGPSSVVNIFIVTPENVNTVPEIEVTSNKKDGSFVVPIVNSRPLSANIPSTTTTPSVTPLPRKTSTKSPGTETREDSSRSGSGVLNPRKLYVY